MLGQRGFFSRSPRTRCGLIPGGQTLSFWDRRPCPQPDYTCIQFYDSSNDNVATIPPRIASYAYALSTAAPMGMSLSPCSHRHESHINTQATLSYVFYRKYTLPRKPWALFLGGPGSDSRSSGLGGCRAMSTVLLYTSAESPWKRRVWVNSLPCTYEPNTPQTATGNYHLTLARNRCGTILGQP